MFLSFKIVTGIYDTVVSPNMLAAGPSYATRGHDLRLQKIRARYDLRKYYFTNRVEFPLCVVANFSFVLIQFSILYAGLLYCDE